MSDYREFIAKTQNDILDAVKHAQETNIKAMTTFSDAVSEFAHKAKSMAPTAAVPTPAEVIESSFAFTSQLIELQKQYYVRIAETFAAAQKKTADAVTTAKKSDK